VYACQYPITPSQHAANGALDLFVEGFRMDDVQQMLVGLSVLRSATAEQVNVAMISVHTRRGTSIADITAMLAR